MLAILKMHSPGCDHCDVLQDCWGIDMRSRLQELAPLEPDLAVYHCSNPTNASCKRSSGQTLSSQIQGSKQKDGEKPVRTR